MGKAREKVTSQVGAWTDEARDMLRAAAFHDTTGGLQTLDEVCEGAVLLELVQGELVVMRYAVRVDAHEHGQEAVIVAAAGRAPGVDLTRQALADVVARVPTCDTLMTVTRRPGLVRKLARLGFTVDGYILRKRLKCH